ncbi:MAG: formylglycine-generating enzyme family protein [Candidatus Riflebacteria bacterium]|nr:formylglycine-generating enzyme family protein [Candidatus Riflebacteria bacterium]
MLLAGWLTVDNTMPVVSAPINTAQILRSGNTSTSTVQSTKTGNIYLVKNGEAATTQAQIDAAVSANKAFLGKSNATANTPYTITLTAGLIDGVYDLVAVDTVDHVSAIVAGWLTVAVDYTSANIGTLKYVPGGTFQRDATPANISTVSTFRMSQYEITQGQFTSVTGLPNPSYFPGVGNNGPVERVNWYHALVFCNKLSINEGFTPAYTISGSTNPANWGSIPTTTNNSTWDAATCNWNANGYRLPTESEWHWTAMGATDNSGKAFAGSTGSNLVDNYVWYDFNSNNTTHTVGSKLPNELGIYDMSGNVMEYCWDWYTLLPSGGLVNYHGATSGTWMVDANGTFHVICGGSWCYASSYAAVSNRFAYSYSAGYDQGFRVVRP